MKIEEHEALLKTILETASAETQASVSEALDKLRADYGETTKALLDVTATATSLTETNESLRKANMGLFERLGNQQVTTQPQANNGQAQQQETKKSYDSLFNEKGELK